MALKCAQAGAAGWYIHVWGEVGAEGRVVDNMGCVRQSAVAHVRAVPSSPRQRHKCAAAACVGAVRPRAPKATFAAGRQCSRAGGRIAPEHDREPRVWGAADGPVVAVLVVAVVVVGTAGDRGKGRG